MPNYRPYAERRPSTAYQDMLRTIREDGVRTESKQGVETLNVAGVQMRFPMAHGAAIITERSIAGFYRKAIGELCAFLNGARTLDELAAFGCDWWGPWATEEKTGARGVTISTLAGGLGAQGYVASIQANLETLVRAVQGGPST